MKKNRGFTFMEVLVATMVLIITLISALRLFNYYIDNTALARARVIYLNEVQRITDEIIYQAELNFGNVLTTYHNTAFQSPYIAKNINLPAFFEIPAAYAFVPPPPPPPPPVGPTAVPGEPAPTVGQGNMGRVYITDIDPNPASTASTTELLRVKVVMCWDQRGRIIGEDLNLNSVLDAGEDINGNGEIDSPCQIETVLVRKD